MANKPARRYLGEILVDAGLIAQAQLKEALALQRQHGGTVGKILVDQGFVSQQDLLSALGQQAGMKYIDLEKTDIAPQVLEMVGHLIASQYKIMPVQFENGVLSIALSDPMNVVALDELSFMLGCQVEGLISTPEGIEKCIEKCYAGRTESVENLLSEMDQVKELVPAAGDDEDIQKTMQMVDLPPVRKLLNLILLQAIKDKASDIHFEPFEGEFRVRYRIDGVLYDMMPPPPHLGNALTSRVKVMSNLDIAERRLPQDGRIELNIGGNPVELRVATLPTMCGESVVMRVLDRSVISLDLERVGMKEDELGLFRQMIAKPNGIILVTGPTGSGKTTTLYSALNELNDGTDKIITVEDPIEYDLEGVVQVQMDEGAGRGFSACLRSILRQDPGIILVGEIRDLESASLSIEASLTGHIVFSTLHTNDAPTAITRLVDLGVEPFLVAATLEGIIAQRLVRTVCSGCKEAYAASPEEVMELNLKEEDVKGRPFYYGKGCDTCNRSGYRGRTGIFEIMLMSDEVKNLIMQQVSTGELRKAARRLGMRTLRESGLLAIFDGATTIEEIIRVTQLGG